MAAAEAVVRFRHTLGDVGPFPFPLSSTISDLKAKLFEAWPTGEISQPSYPTLSDSCRAPESSPCFQGGQRSCALGNGAAGLLIAA